MFTSSFNWAKSNLSHLFSIIGIILTIYFSIFYIPQYSNELKLKKMENIHSDLINTIQELVYNKHIIDQMDIETLIKGKEFKHNISYIYNIDELLIQVQESFLSNKFIPLNERKKLVDNIDEVRSTIKVKKDIKQEENKYYNYSLAAILSTIFGIIASLLGSISLISTKNIKDKEEIEQKIFDEKDDIQNKIKTSMNFEDYVGDLLKQKFGLNNVQNQLSSRDSGLDFIIKKDNEIIFGIEVKYIRSTRLHPRQIDKFIMLSGKVNYPIIIITNEQISESYINKLNNMLSKRNITIITIDNIDKIDSIINNKQI